MIHSASGATAAACCSLSERTACKSVPIGASRASTAGWTPLRSYWTANWGSGTCSATKRSYASSPNGRLCAGWNCRSSGPPSSVSVSTRSSYRASHRTSLSSRSIGRASFVRRPVPSSSAHAPCVDAPATGSATGHFRRGIGTD